MPVFIALALVLVVLQPRLNALARTARDRRGGTSTASLTPLAVFVTGIYGGYFGAAQGILLLGDPRRRAAAGPAPHQRAQERARRPRQRRRRPATSSSPPHVAWAPAALIAAGSIVGGQLGAQLRAAAAPRRAAGADRRRRHHRDRAPAHGVSWRPAKDVAGYPVHGNGRPAGAEPDRRARQGGGAPPPRHEGEGLTRRSTPGSRRSRSSSTRPGTSSASAAPCASTASTPKRPAAAPRTPSSTTSSSLSAPPLGCSRLGALAEWLRSGLQSRLHRFDSGRRLWPGGAPELV